MIKLINTGRHNITHALKSGRHNLMKRSFKFLRKIDEKRREAQRLSQAANTEEQLAFNASLQNKAAFHHMIAERNRKIKLKQHFSLLHSLLPHNSKVLYSSIFCITSLSKLNSRQFASKIKVLNILLMNIELQVFIVFSFNP